MSAMMINEIPSASAVIGTANPAGEAVVVSAPLGQEQVHELAAQLKALDAASLFKLMKTALTEAEKKSKAAAKPAAKAAEKKKTISPKSGSPKGKQLVKPRMWVSYVLEYCKENGWDSFIMNETHKDKVTGEKVEEEIEMPASELCDGVHVFQGSVTAKQPKGKTLVLKDAMSLSKQMWSRADKTGTHEAVYNEFVAAFEATHANDSEEMEVDTEEKPAKKSVVRKTAAEKAVEQEEKKALKEAEKAEKKAAKELEKAEKKAAKELESAEKKAVKEAEKEAKKAAKEASPKSAPAKKAAAVTPAKKAAATPAAAPAAPVKAAKKPVAPKKEEEKEWVAPTQDGAVYPWEFKGKKYLRNSDNQVWLANGDEAGDWQGVYDSATKSIDDSVADPFADSDNEDEN